MTRRPEDDGPARDEAGDDLARDEHVRDAPAEDAPADDASDAVDATAGRATRDEDAERDEDADHAEHADARDEVDERADAHDDDAGIDDDDDEPEARAERRSDVVIVSLVFVVLFGYDLLEAATNLSQAPAFYEAFGIAERTPWVALVAGVVAPPVLFAAASALGRGRRLVARAGILLVGLAVSAQVALLLEAVSRATLGV